MPNLLDRLGRTTALIVASSFVVYAAADGNLAVTVLDAAGKPLAGATVVISSPTQIGGARTQVTDANGKIRFVRLTPGLFKVVASANGFQSQTLAKVEVLIDQTANVNLKMVPVGGAVIEVVGTLPTVDVTTVTAGTQLTQEELTQLPVARNQLATLTLVPGVVSVGGNPSLAAGNNRDNLGNNGARNNTYMLDGIDVTSPESGTYRTTIPQELIQNQDVKTGAITAEYSARAGLFSNVVTIPGGNEFQGGLIYAKTDPSWASQPALFIKQAPGHSVDDTTAFLSGPILKDKLWFVLSYQKIKDTVDVTLDSAAAAFAGEKRTSTGNDESRTFAKLTWQIAEGHLLSGTFNRNPGFFDNGTTVGTPTRRLAKTERGGDRYTFAYTWQMPSFVLDIKTIQHKETDTQKALFTADGPQVDVIFPTVYSPSVNESTFGNSSLGNVREYKRNLTRVDGTFLFDAAGSHTLKTGFQFGQDQLTQTLLISQGAQYENFNAATTYANVLSAVSSMPNIGYGGNVKGARSKVLAAINGVAAYAAIKTALDTDLSGTVDLAELGAVNFSTLYDAGNPALGYLGYRFIMSSAASSTPKMETQGFYVQDQWQMGRLTVSPGFRADKYEYKADNGQSLFKTDWAFAPRVGLSYDVNGDGRTKAYAYWGRYIDPIKLDMVRFTGSLTSSVRNEDIYINGTWVTENVRGGSKVVDAVFADTFKLPKTDEFRVGLAKDFGNAWAVEGVYTYRRDYDIVEDWDPTLYTNSDNLEDEARALFGLGTRALVPYASLSSQGKAIVDKFRGLTISPEYFTGGGYSGTQNVARVASGTLNFVLANLPGGHRVYNTFDMTVTRKFKDNWGGFYTFSTVRATGNSQSSGNADYQGDLAQYDPRLPYMNGRLDGSIDWQHKLYAYYKWDNGFLVGVTCSWNSGYHFSDGEQVGTRVLLKAPALADAFTEQAGKNRTPEVKQVDARIQYSRKFGLVKGEVFLDAFNLFNRQTEVDIAEGNGLTAANPLGTRRGVSKGQAFTWLEPRRFTLGVKILF